MDFGYSRWVEAQRVFGNSENICLEKSEIKKGSKSVNPCQIRPVERVSGNKKNPADNSWGFVFGGGAGRGFSSLTRNRTSPLNTYD